MEEVAKSKANRRKWTRRTLLGGGALVLVAAIVAAWLPKPIAVDVATVSRKKMQVAVTDDGRTRVRDHYVVSSPLAGDLARIELRAGDEVKAEQVLARLVPMSAPLLDPRSRAEAEARMLQAEAARKQAHANVAQSVVAHDFAKEEAARQAALIAKGAASAQALEHARMEERSLAEQRSSAEFAEQVAIHQLAQAEIALRHTRGGRADKSEYLVVPSPTAGRVLKVIQASAGPVPAGAPLLEIGDPSKLEIVVDVLTADAVQISAGAKASIDHWGGDATLAAHVRRVEPSAFTRVSALGVEEQRVNVVLDLDDPRERWVRLGDGYRVDVSIIVWEKDDVVVLPQGAVFRRGDHWAVYVVEGGVAHERSVEVGKRNGTEVQVAKGLEVGQSVVLYPSDRVVDNAKVVARGG